jgi:hypothetical protein
MNSNKDILLMVETGCHHWVLESQDWLRFFVNATDLVQVQSFYKLFALVVEDESS